MVEGFAAAMAIVLAVAAFGWLIVALIRAVRLDGYGHRAPPRATFDPARDWSTDLPTRPYREV